MNKQNGKLSTGELRDILKYDEDTGALTWTSQAGRRCVAGKVAGHINKDGVRVISINGNKYRANRLAWWIKTGCNPTELVAHIKGRSNAWRNLELITAKTRADRRKLRKDSRLLKRDKEREALTNGKNKTKPKD
ncbi:MAG: hypothetical protein JKY89_06015 [Immundisolibacteraceae bacterium]|nr:hypothetical protein [Immundisolibacteraceae bacterium]